MSDREHNRRCYAIIPAAGLSRRMQRPKLLLEVDGQTVIERLVDALRTGGVDGIHVLARRDDEALRDHLAGLAVISHLVSHETPDMRASVQHLLSEVSCDASPMADDAWLLCPADHPVLNAAVVARLLTESTATPDQILVPAHAGRRGHPTCFPWRLAELVPNIPEGQGLNWLLKQGGTSVREVAVNDPSVLCDLDTPEDYQRLIQQFGKDV